MKRFLISMLVLSPMVLCAMQGDPAAPAAAGVGAAIVEDQARKDAAAYERVIKIIDRALIRKRSRACGRARPLLSELDNYGGALGRELRALLLPRGDEHKRYAVHFIRAFVYGFAHSANVWLGHDATSDEMLKGLIDAKKRRDEAAK